MKAKDSIICNFEEIRRRSIKLWSAIPAMYYTWKPDEEAFSVLEMIRHVLEGEHLYHMIITRKEQLNGYQSPWLKVEYVDLKKELAIAAPFRKRFIEMIQGVSDEDMTNIIIERKECNQRYELGNYLNRIAYHEAVHTGQMLDYLRTIGVPRSNIWD
ncbi:DinB family protein [Aquimarina hainanensis]|uniref:DinB family protein n=1 Tax=Aquimarina hainanensis TaxID=1578017 RepID=A0ABW5N6D2_9FLAO